MTCDHCTGRYPERSLCAGCREDIAYSAAEARSQALTDAALPRVRFIRPVFSAVVRDDCWGAA